MFALFDAAANSNNPFVLEGSVKRLLVTLLPGEILDLTEEGSVITGLWADDYVDSFFAICGDNGRVLVTAHKTIDRLHTLIDAKKDKYYVSAVFRLFRRGLGLPKFVADSIVAYFVLMDEEMHYSARKYYDNGRPFLIRDICAYNQCAPLARLHSLEICGKNGLSTPIVFKNSSKEKTVHLALDWGKVDKRKPKPMNQLAALYNCYTTNVEETLNLRSTRGNCFIFELTGDQKVEDEIILAQSGKPVERFISKQCKFGQTGFYILRVGEKHEKDPLNAMDPKNAIDLEKYLFWGPMQLSGVPADVQICGPAENEQVKSKENKKMEWLTRQREKRIEDAASLLATKKRREHLKQKEWEKACLNYNPEMLQDEELAADEIPVQDMFTFFPLQAEDTVVLSDGNCYSKRIMRDVLEKYPNTKLMYQKALSEDDYAELGTQKKKFRPRRDDEDVFMYELDKRRAEGKSVSGYDCVSACDLETSTCKTEPYRWFGRKFDWDYC